VHGWGLTVYGVAALTFMMAMYALERRGAGFILAFALGCLLASGYGFASGAWPFGVVEAVWCLVAVRRYLQQARSSSQERTQQRRAGQPDGPPAQPDGPPAQPDGPPG
jgi:hypothetical protein